ncbi:MAG TPA: tetratricopeptide repeat protein [Pyrinomonadaceae bacterium]|nr:tetratricopeptide repeat protein [Pyrinomonadaceae bacterium]
MTRPGFKDAKAGRVGAVLAAGGLAAALFLCAAASAAGQPRELPRITQPSRVLTVQGQVSLPEGMPAGQVMVTLIDRGGVPRHAYTTEHGRFEFEGIPEGAYSLSAKSLTDPALSVEGVEADTTRTATGSLNISLTLRKDATPPGVTRKPEVLTAAEAEQQVPKPARRAFREAVKFREENQPEKALESLSRAVELYPDYFQALAERADLLVARRKLAEACKDFERALKLNPRYAPALRGAGYCKLENREFAEAAAHLERAATAQPNNPGTLLLLGIAYLELDRRDEARAALIKALAFNVPQAARAHIYLGKLFARERLYREAADELRKYLEANPSAPDAAELKAVEAQWRALAPSP